MDYKNLTPEEQNTLLKNTLIQIEREHFANTLALRRAEAINDDTQIKLFEDELEKLDAQFDALT
jgi:hypothetical protein